LFRSPIDPHSTAGTGKIILGKVGDLVLRPKQRIHFLVMAGLGPAIHAFAADRSARCECVDARHKAGHDEWLGTVSSE
jgi:hypothetical protein